MLPVNRASSRRSVRFGGSDFALRTFVRRPERETTVPLTPCRRPCAWTPKSLRLSRLAKIVRLFRAVRPGELPDPERLPPTSSLGRGSSDPMACHDPNKTSFARGSSFRISLSRLPSARPAVHRRLTFGFVPTRRRSLASAVRHNPRARPRASQVFCGEKSTLLARRSTAENGRHGAKPHRPAEYPASRCG